MSTEESIIRTLDWITDVDKLSISVQKCQENIDVKNVCLLEEYSNLLSDLNKHRGKEIKK
jgi:hypothetical protein